MIAVGTRWSLAWRHPHRLEAVVTALEPDHVLCEVDHRCGFACYLKGMRGALPIEGPMRYKYDDFAKLFVPMAEDAIALPA
jgi:hypothetical protein